MGSLGEWERARRTTIVAPLFDELAKRFACAPISPLFWSPMRQLPREINQSNNPINQSIKLDYERNRDRRAKRRKRMGEREQSRFYSCRRIRGTDSRSVRRTRNVARVAARMRYIIKSGRAGEAQE